MVTQQATKTLDAMRRTLSVDIGAKSMCLMALVGQCAFMDHFLIHYGTGPGFRQGYIWIMVDAFVFICWLIAFILSRRNFDDRFPELPRTQRDMIHEFPFAYASWLIYAGVLIAKLIRIIHNIDIVGIEQGIFSPIVLKITVSISAVTLVLLSYSHHEDEENKQYKLQVQKLGSIMALAILDSADLLDMLVCSEIGMAIPYHLRSGILALGCICIVLPVIPLFAIRVISTKSRRKKQKKKEKKDKNLKKVRDNSTECPDGMNGSTSWEQVVLLQSVLYLILVDLPFFAVRFHLWLMMGMNPSVFLTKNLLMFVRAMMDLMNELPACPGKKEQEKPLLELGFTVRFNTNTNKNNKNNKK